MANNSITAFDKSPHPVTLDTSAPKQKSPFSSEDMTVALPIENKTISEADAEKLQYFDDINSLVKKFRELLNGAGQRTEISDDLSLKRQYTLNSITNLLSSMDNVALTDEELSLLDKTGFEMSQELSDSSLMWSSTWKDSDNPYKPNDCSPTPTIIASTSTPTPAAVSKSTKGDNVICQNLSELLHKADSEYLHAYEYAMKVRSKFQENIAHIQQEIPKHIYNDSDKKNQGNLKIDSKDIYEAFEKTFDFGDSYDSVKKRTLYPPGYADNGTMVSKEDAEHWAKEFAGSKVVKREGSGGEEGYIVVIDYDAVINLRKSINDIKIFGKVTEYPVNGRSMTATQFQTWQTGFNNDIESIKTATQEIAQSYNSANSTMSTLAKLMTSCISTLYESSNMCLRF